LENKIAPTVKPNVENAATIMASATITMATRLDNELKSLHYE
jgi:hypothetical protein